MTRALVAVLCVGILVAWSPQLWASCLVEIGAFTLCAICVVRAWKRDQPLGLGAIAILLAALLAAMVAWGGLQLLTGITVDRFETRKAVLSASANLAMFVSAASLLRGAGERAWFRNALLWFGCGVNGVAMAQIAAGGGRGFGPFVYRNQYAAFVELLFPLALYQGLRGRRGSWVYLCVAGGFFAGVAAAASRAGVALLAVELAAMAALAWAGRWLPRRRLAGSVAAVMALSAAFTAAAGWENIWSRFEDSESYQVRSKLLASTVAMIRARPWSGFGLGTWRVAYPAYATFDSGLTANQAHNDWAEWMAEGGAGFVLLPLAVACWSAARAVRHPWALGVAAVFLHSLVDYPLREPALAVLLYSVLGALAAACAEAGQLSKYSPSELEIPLLRLRLYSRRTDPPIIALRVRESRIPRVLTARGIPGRAVGAVRSRLSQSYALMVVVLVVLRVGMRAGAWGFVRLGRRQSAGASHWRGRPAGDRGL